MTKDLKSKYSKEELDKISSNFFQNRIVKLVNPKMIDLIHKLDQRNIPTTALTGGWTGKFGSITQMEELRFKGLNNFTSHLLECLYLRKIILSQI